MRTEEELSCHVAGVTRRRGGRGGIRRRRRQKSEEEEQSNEGIKRERPRFEDGERRYKVKSWLCFVATGEVSWGDSEQHHLAKERETLIYRWCLKWKKKVDVWLSTTLLNKHKGSK